jgi:bifunctional DNA-binding transcriptional regulator/antitoxin component of YhaV-PrlF toxin-antitoxin module
MALIKLRRAAQITLPLELRQAFQLKERDDLEAQTTDDGILLRPVSINRREPTPEQEEGILSVIDAERKPYAEKRRR